MRFLVTGGSGFIGTNVVDDLLARGNAVLNFSDHAPLDVRHRSVWKYGDILDGESVSTVFFEFKPDVVIHLAARADCDENTTVVAGYSANTVGTSNVLSAIKRIPSVKRVIITSSQYVCGPERLPLSIDDFFPHTIYGQSKVLTEQLTHQAALSCCWTIIRPTNIWGPWHMRYSREFWRIASKKLYFHPAGPPVVRSYGYVGTVIDQMTRILELPEALVTGRTLYVGEPADDIYKWANGFCRELTGSSAPRVPRPALRCAALVGDGISSLTGKPFYLTSSRYRSMISDYPAPMSETLALLGPSKWTLEEGIRRTVQWFRAAL